MTDTPHLAARPDLPPAPTPDRVREALARVLASDEFRSSPQLCAFITYVVEKTLQGKEQEVKGYTIAVEALGRDPSFDPTVDPIVRVEATRLRRAIDRYYNGAGSTDPLRIAIPRGSYVPEFRALPVTEADLPAAPPTAPDPLPGPPDEPVAEAALADAVAGPLVNRPAPRRNPFGALWRGLALASFILAAAALVIALQSRPRPTSVETVAPAAPTAPAEAPTVTAATPPIVLVDPSTRRRRTAPVSIPVVFVRSVDTIGQTPADAALTPRTLQLRLRDALSRFDEVRVLAGSPVALTELGTLPLTPADLMTRSDFALGATIEWGDDSGAAVSFRLVDVQDGTLLWARRFERLGGQPPEAFVEAMVRQVATTVAQPYGVVQARQRARALASGQPAERFVCVLEAFEYWRSFEPVRHLESRSCLERAVERDPTFVLGFATLAAIYLEEYRTGLNLRPGEPLARDRALAVARLALQLAPESARVQQALLDVHFVRGEIEPALLHGSRAIELNPYDTDILADFGARLIANGDIQRGTAYLERASAYNTATPAWVEFFLFLAAHLRNETEKAHYHAGLITTDTYPLGLVARIISAADRGDAARTRAEVARLARLQPDWISDPRTALERFFPSRTIIERLLADLDRAGLSAGGR